MLGFVRFPSAALVTMVLGSALVTAVSGTSEAAPKKTSPPPEDSEPIVDTTTETESDDIQMTVQDPGAGKSKKAAPKKKAEPKQQAEPKKKKKKKGEVEPVEVMLEEEEEPEQPIEEEPPPPRYKKNWISLSIQQDLLSFSTTSNVCPSTDAMGRPVAGDEQYSCRDANGVYAGPVYAGAGNQVQGGFGFATTRILIGYERVFIDRLTVGGRIGYAFGTAPTVEGAGAAIPFHFEVRAAYYFGKAPFERRSIRPFASLGVGMGEIDGVVPVEIYQAAQGPIVQVDAWRKTGTGFIAPGGGAAYPIGDFAVFAELRPIFMLGAPAFALGIGLGASYGF